MASEEELRKYRNQTYVRLVRVSDDGDKQNSDKAQLAFLKGWADERQMIHVADFVEAGLSGSLPGNRSDLQAVLDRADTLKDFKFVLSQRIDRATRGGADHLFWFEYELKRRGVKLVVPGDGLPEGVPFGNTLRAAKADAAQETAISTSQRSAQGSQYGLESRRVSPHSRTPFGCYRLYCKSDGTGQFVIVDKRNGLQEKRSWPDLQLIDTYGQIGGGQVGHYRKQKSELVYLVPGEPYERETVNIIFCQRYLEGKTGRKIAQYLNRLGRPAPLGGKWSPRQVESIYENEDYTGRGIANRKSSARYNRRRSGAPQRVELDDKTVTTAKRIKPIVRPTMEWFEGKEPHMETFLTDPNVRLIATEQQARLWERRLDPTWERPNRKKYPDSPYLLHPLLVAKQDGEVLVGSRSGRRGKPVRIYRHKRVIRECEQGGIYGRIFNADALEKAVLTVLQEILRDWPELEQRVLHHLKAQIELAGQQNDLLQTKEEQRQEVRDQLLLYVRSLTPKTQADLQPEIRRLEDQRDALDTEITMIRKQRSAKTVDPEKAATLLKEQLMHLADQVEKLPPYVLKAVLAAFTAKLEADMETKGVTFEFHLPIWMVAESARAGLAALCTSTSSESSTGLGTQHEPSLYIKLAQGTCHFARQQRSMSCKCHRVKRAA